MCSREVLQTLPPQARSQVSIHPLTHRYLNIIGLAHFCKDFVLEDSDPGAGHQRPDRFR